MVFITHAHLRKVIPLPFPGQFKGDTSEVRQATYRGLF